MAKLICSKCKQVFKQAEKARCPKCGSTAPHVYDFENSEEYLDQQVPLILEERKEAGLEGLVGGLDSVLINVEAEMQMKAVREILNSTGLRITDAFGKGSKRTYVLGGTGGADLLITIRDDENPFQEMNEHPRTSHLPNTRLETLVFETSDVNKYLDIQRSRGVSFMTEDVVHGEGYSFVQTTPSRFTGNSLGFIQWLGSRKDYRQLSSDPLDWDVEPKKEFLKKIGKLDHAATRIRAEHRDLAILELISLTNYHFDFAIYVKVFNSITSVARLSQEDFAMVFTSGISNYSGESSGPTETFVHNYGPRVHHLAFQTEDIEETFQALRNDGQKFLIDLVGSPDEGLRQTFTEPFPSTLLVNEYIHRYGDFDGFFTKNNVTLLTEATGRQ
ncbi:MAG TPA: hypothetical protein VMW26_08480 [Methanomassiliicoccales archaeon]|nr:hypothetical protein [Methanomassiliicoccales archaeon]